MKKVFLSMNFLCSACMISAMQHAQLPNRQGLIRIAKEAGMSESAQKIVANRFAQKLVVLNKNKQDFEAGLPSLGLAYYMKDRYVTTGQIKGLIYKRYAWDDSQGDAFVKILLKSHPYELAEYQDLFTKLCVDNDPVPMEE